MAQVVDGAPKGQGPDQQRANLACTCSACTFRKPGPEPREVLCLHGATFAFNSAASSGPCGGCRSNQNANSPVSKPTAFDSAASSCSNLERGSEQTTTTRPPARRREEVPVVGAEG